MKKVLIEIIFWTWCLPQTLVGLIVKLIFRGKINWWLPYNYKHLVTVYESKTLPGAISLGKYIILGPNNRNELNVKHEKGHQKQSFILGPLYLLIIGLPSLIWCWIIHPLTKKSYYWFYTEKWADKLGGIDDR